MNTEEIEVRLVGLSDLHQAALQKFNRYQVTNRVKFKDSDRFLYKDDHFVESWDDNKKIWIIEQLRNCIQTDGIAAGALVDGYIIGFASVEGQFFGKNKEYLELSYVHTSYEYRGKGIGKKLFSLCCEKAKEKGAKKLYISTHPAEETQQYYEAMGCVPAVEINQEIFDREPLDIQLEVSI